MKYYYVFYWYQYAINNFLVTMPGNQQVANIGYAPVGVAINKHPFTFMAEDVIPWLATFQNANCELTSWQEISEEEYRQWRKMHGYEN